jgi:hypothetical protein
MRKRIEQLLALSLYEWCLMLSAMLVLPIIGLLLRVIGFKRTQALLNRLTAAEKDPAVPAAAELEKAHVVARMVAIAARYGPYRAGCLRQSLLIQWILALQGISSDIRFGVEKERAASFSAHAWVACRGVNICDSETSQRQFLVFAENSEMWGNSITMDKS